MSKEAPLITFRRDWYSSTGYHYRARDGAQPLIGGEGLNDLPSDALVNGEPKANFLARPAPVPAKKEKN